MRDNNGEARHPGARGGPAAGASAKRARSVRFQLLFAVSAILLAGLLSLLVLDYARERRQRLHDRQVALSEEANLLLPIVSELQSQGTRAVQEYLDRACRRVQDATSPAHHLAVRTGQKLLQARTHGSVSPTVLQVAREGEPGASGRAEVGGRLILIGSAGSGELRVWVSEYADEILAASRWQLLTRSLGMGIFGLLVTGVTSVVIVRLVSRPVEQLAATVRRIGRGELQAVAEPTGGAEFQFLAREINAMGAALDAAERQRRRQMEKARRVQTRLCPSTGPLTGWSVASIYEPADEVGGDLIDVRPVAERRLVVCIADVTGHGVAAAMGAAVLKMLFDTALQQHPDDPAGMLQFINERFSVLSLEEDFASMLIALLDQGAASVTYASAGHDPAYLIGPDDMRLLESTGPLLGIDPAASWQAATAQLTPGDRLVLVTDGWAESASMEGARFGRERLQTLLALSGSEVPERTAQRAAEQTAFWRAHRPASDDLSMLVIEWPVEPAVTGRRVALAGWRADGPDAPSRQAATAGAPPCPHPR